jgi:hypothetical protein
VGVWNPFLALLPEAISVDVDSIGAAACKKSNTDSGNVFGDPIASNGSKAVSKLLGAT